MSDFARRANNWCTRDDREMALCEKHEVWHDPGFVCPDCQLEEDKRQAERKRIKRELIPVMDATRKLVAG